MKAIAAERGSHAPGTFWYYNNWDFNALGTIFDQETGQESVYQAFQAWVADPIGMQDLDIERLSYAYEPQSIHPYYGFRISARDLARFGQLYLQDGAWQGRQVVPAEWVAESTVPYSRTGQSGTYSGYGYMWWIAVRRLLEHPPRIVRGQRLWRAHARDPARAEYRHRRANRHRPPYRATARRRDIDRLVIEILRASNRCKTRTYRAESIDGLGRPGRRLPWSSCCGAWSATSSSPGALGWSGRSSSSFLAR